MPESAAKSAGRSLPAVLAVLLLSPVFGQQSHPSASASSPSVVSNVDEVALDVEAYDKKGNPVPDLKPGDIEVTDGRTAVHLKDLRLVSEPSRAQPLVLLFDEMEPGNAKSARDAALEILKAAPADTSFMVLRIQGRLYLMQSPTSDRDALTKAVNAATVATGPAAAAQATAAETALQQDMNGGPHVQESSEIMKMLVDSQNATADPHMTPSVAGLLAVCRGEGGTPGRKTLIYFSQSLAWNVSAPESLHNIVEAANRSRVTIDSIDAHPIDPHASSEMLATSALATQAGAGHTGFGGGSGSSTPTGNVGPAGMADQVAEQNGRFENEDPSVSKAPLESICRQTGGVHEYSGNARRSTRRIVDNLSSWYVASYTIPGEAEQGRFRPVFVKSLRPGVVLTARSGYFVPPRASHPAIAFEPRLLAALAAPNPPQDLKLRSALLRFGGTSALVLAAPLSDAEIRTDAAAKTWSAHLVFLGQLKDKSGKVVDSFSEDVPKQGAVEGKDKASHETITVHRHFSIPAGDYVLEAAVLDVNSEKTGVQRADVSIPAAGAGPGLSDIVLARRVDPWAGDEDVDRASPLRCSDGRVVPNLAAHVSKTADPTLTLFFQVYPQRGASVAPTLKAEVRRDGGLIGTVPLKLGPTEGKEFVPYLAQLGTSSLQPGAYTMTVILEQGGEQAKQSVSFTLE